MQLRHTVQGLAFRSLQLCDQDQAHDCHSPGFLLCTRPLAFLVLQLKPQEAMQTVGSIQTGGFRLSPVASSFIKVEEAVAKASLWRTPSAGRDAQTGHVIVGWTLPGAGPQSSGDSTPGPSLARAQVQRPVFLLSFPN